MLLRNLAIVTTGGWQIVLFLPSSESVDVITVKPGLHSHLPIFHPFIRPFLCPLPLSGTTHSPSLHGPCVYNGTHVSSDHNIVPRLVQISSSNSGINNKLLSSLRPCTGHFPFDFNSVALYDG